MKLQKIGILAITFLTLNSQAMEKPCTSIDGLRKDTTSFYSWLLPELHGELYKFATNDSAINWLLHKHAESVGFNAKRLEGNIGGCCLKLDKASSCFFSAGLLDHTISVWNLITGKCQQILEGHTGNVSCLAADKANNHIFSGSWDHTIRMWNLISDRCEKILEGHTGEVFCLVVDKVNKHLISGSIDNTIKVWDLISGEYQQTLEGHEANVSCLAMDKVNNRLISGSYDKTIKVWNLENGECEMTLKGHTFGVFCLAVNKTTQQLFSGAGDYTIKVWNLKNGQCCYSIGLPARDVREINEVAGYVFCEVDGDTMIYELEDASLKNSLEKSMDTAYLLESAYNCSQNKQELNLRNNEGLHAAFTRLPLALQKVIQKEVTVQLPS